MEVREDDENKIYGWLKSGKYLPRFMRDFHDQKDAFKAIHEIVHENESTKAINWVDAHCYVIDVFLWFMARHGYTLQKSRVDMPFIDVEERIKEQKEKRSAMFYAALKDGMSK